MIVDPLDAVVVEGVVRGRGAVGVHAPASEVGADLERLPDHHRVHHPIGVGDNEHRLTAQVLAGEDGEFAPVPGGHAGDAEHGSASTEHCIVLRRALQHEEGDISLRQQLSGPRVEVDSASVPLRGQQDILCRVWRVLMHHVDVDAVVLTLPRRQVVRLALSVDVGFSGRPQHHQPAR